MDASILKNAKIIFWDFDGVIKESTEVKSESFRRLFKEYGEDIVNKISAHHLKNQGISRRDKISLYLGWTDQSVNQKLINEYCMKFSDYVYCQVINSPWVPGVYGYIKKNYKQQKFVIVSAAPADEMLRISKALNIKKYFLRICGHPPDKSISIRAALNDFDINPCDAIFIGDAQADMEAARQNNVRFILRMTTSNIHLQASYDGLVFSDLKI